MKPTLATPSIAALALGLTSLAGAGAAGADDSVTFDPTYQVGKRYHFEQNITSSMEMAMGELKMDQKTAMIINLSLGVREGEDGNKLVVAKNDRLRADMDMLGQKLGYDSDDPSGSNALISGIFATAMGGETTLVFDEEDNFIEVRASETPATPKSGALGGMMDSTGNLGGQVEQFAKNLVGDEFPDGPVEPGHTWETNQSMDVPQMGELKTELKNTYVGMETPEGAPKPLARVDFEGTLGSGSGEAKSGATSVGIKGGTVKGSYFYDPEARIMRRTDLEMEMSISMNNGETTMVLPTKQSTSAVLTKIEDL